jgi:hypothetical protein
MSGPTLRQYGRTWTWPPPVPAAIAKREPFRSGALRGQDGPPSSYGRLALEYVRILEREQPSYLVMSYATPIAWWSLEHGWTLPDERYSVTTGRHQGYVRTAMTL